MESRSSLRLWRLTLLLALGACGGGVDLEMAELSAPEAEALAAAALFATLNSTSALPARPEPSSDTGGGTSSPWALDFEAEVQCPMGGGVVLAAAMVVEGGTNSGPGRASYRLAEVHEGCSAGTLADGRLELSGAPRMHAWAEVHRDRSGGIAWAGEASGRLRWRTGARQGACDLDVAFSATGTDGRPGALRMQGTACGHALEAATPIP